EPRREIARDQPRDDVDGAARDRGYDDLHRVVRIALGVRPRRRDEANARKEQGASSEPASSRRIARRRLRHGASNPSPCTLGAHLAMSALIVAVNACGVPPRGSLLSLASAAMNSGDFTPSLIWALSSSITSFGVCAGANKPVQLVDTKPGKPL